MTLFITASLIMTILLTHNMGDITYNDITYNDFTYNDNTFNTQYR